MSIAAVTIALLDDTQSTVGAETVGPWVKIGHQEFDVHITVAPAALVEVEVSEDKINVATATNRDDAANTVTGEGASYHSIRERPLWARGVIAADASGPRGFSALAAIRKDNS